MPMRLSQWLGALTAEGWCRGSLELVWRAAMFCARHTTHALLIPSAPAGACIGAKSFISALVSLTQSSIQCCGTCGESDVRSVVVCGGQCVEEHG